GLEVLGARRIAMLTPWADDVNRFAESYIADRGFEIPIKGSFKRTDGYEIHRVSPEAVYDAGLKLGRADVDGLLISGTGLRVSPVLESLEDALGKPVITSTQALAWHGLRLAGIDDPVAGYGRLLKA
ncbi:MAG: Asp/Glu racemase, partial [Nitrospinota bacterium]|nr:Asp/Glu racemase [Nitrospinota bacterium]